MKYVYVRRGDGLGTRILAIMQAKILSDHLGHPLRIVWPNILAPHYADNNLLASSELAGVLKTEHFFCDDEENNGEIYREEDFSALSLINANSVKSEDLANRDKVEEILEGRDGLIYGEPYQILSNEQLGLDVGVRMKSLWSKMNWADSFKDSIHDFERSYQGSNAIAVHARRGDIVSMLQDASIEYLLGAGMEQLLQRFVAVRSFLRHIRARQNTFHNIVVCGEDSEVANAIASAFKNKRILSTRCITGSETKKAFMDLYLLSKSVAVIAPYHSYFSGCAAIVGNCEFEPINLSVPEALEEIYDIIDASGRDDKVAVKSLACSMYGRMLSHGTKLKTIITLETSEN